MTTIKALEGRTVHQIQSGQVIVDLCSVVKELVENSLDAGATAIDVRFKGNGLESIEVQDNGVGIASENYETLQALKHYTSKLASYDDLASLQTFGFRGEALSSLCALSNLHVVTARAEDAPKGTRLDFEISGKLKSTQVVASQKGTTVAVENIFANLPVRRRELDKNIKREYGKALTILQAYACISAQVKLSVSNVMPKGKKATVFASKTNNTTRENIANVFGAKVLPGLVGLDLRMELQQSSKTPLQGWITQPETEDRHVRVVGHVSRPVFGEGRHTTDRQMFFVNSRPCGLPQIAKVFNEVYRSFNVSQSPFVFANMILDTNSYDVNVSPDKRTILLHNQDILLESLRKSLTKLFEEQDQTVPQTQSSFPSLPPFRKPTLLRETSTADLVAHDSQEAENVEEFSKDDIIGSDAQSGIICSVDQRKGSNLIEGFATRDTVTRMHRLAAAVPTTLTGKSSPLKDKQKLCRAQSERAVSEAPTDDFASAEADALESRRYIPVSDFNKKVSEQQLPSDAGELRLQDSSGDLSEDGVPALTSPSSRPSPGIVQTAFDRMRPRRQAIEVAEVTIGDATTTVALGPTMSKRQKVVRSHLPSFNPQTPTTLRFSSSMRSFVAPGTQLEDAEDGSDNGSVGQDSNGDDTAEYVMPSCSEDEASAMEERLDTVVKTPLVDEDPRTSELESDQTDDAEDNDEFLDDNDAKSREIARVTALVRQAEEAAALPSQNNLRRAHNVLKGRNQKDSTTQLLQVIEESIDQLDTQLQYLGASLEASRVSQQNSAASPDASSPEERLSLIVSKDDFSRMRIVGQFNLGFILAVRPAPSSGTSDELFIIDQHASDEKSNFERLQATTVVQNQRLVHACRLDLTAIEEEIILDNNSALLKNGFLVDVDTSGDSPVGQRCNLTSLPMSREVTFNISDLEELISLLAECAPSTDTAMENVPRPSKVRKMFAMRACRSSIMIGRSLSQKQMRKLVRKMGEIEKPWNCPHGRPTMRHVSKLSNLQYWEEDVRPISSSTVGQGEEIDWAGWMGKMRETGDNKTQGMEDSELGSEFPGMSSAHDHVSGRIEEEREESIDEVEDIENADQNSEEGMERGPSSTLLGHFAYD